MMSEVAGHCQGGPISFQGHFLYGHFQGHTLRGASLQASRSVPYKAHGGAFAPSCHETWTELVRRIAAHRGGPTRSLLVEEIHQGLSHALLRGVGKQLRSLLMAQEYGYQAPPFPSR